MESNNPLSQIEISESELSVFRSSIQDMCRLENVPNFSPLQSTLGFMSSQPETRDDQILDNDVHGSNFSDQSIGVTELPPYQDSDPMILLNNLVFLEKKVLDLKGVVKSMNHERLDLSHSEDISIDSRQQMVVSEIASIISYMISIGKKLLNLNQKKGQGNSCSNLNPIISQLGNLDGADGSLGAQNSQEIPNSCFKIVTGSGNRVEEKLMCPIQEAEVDSDAGLDVAEAMKDENGDGEEENHLSSPGCYEVCELEKEEILAPHTHFCVICNKGFKRDANLRMHMRGHGDIFKTTEALANPNKGTKADLINSRRYSCPFEGCKRNQKHKKFQPLKTILCVKNHYKRSHCDKSYICSRCKCKKFSVIADLKTHEKHCGEDKWKCSCGTTFSRKDKLFGHVSLFHGHTPVLPMKEVKRCKISEEGKNTERKDTDVSIGSKTSNFNCGFNSNEGAQGFLGTGSVPSEDLSCGHGYDQPLFADTQTQNQEMKNNFNPGTSENPKSSSILMDDFFSFESLLSCSFIGPDLEDFLSDKSMIL